MHPGDALDAEAGALQPVGEEPGGEGARAGASIRSMVEEVARNLFRVISGNTVILKRLNQVNTICRQLKK